MSDRARHADRRRAGAPLGRRYPERPWPPGEAHRAHKPYPVTKDMALDGIKEAGVDRVVIVPPSWEDDRNDLALEAARLHPDRFAVMERLAIEKPESRVLVDGWKRQPGTAGCTTPSGRAGRSGVPT